MPPPSDAEERAAPTAGTASRLLRAWEGRGPLACALWPLSWVMRAGVAARHAAHRVGLLRSERLPVPVLVVGNLVAGGAGKTPAVLAAVRALQARGWRPGIVSRGYARNPSAPPVLLVDTDTPARDAGDEPLLLRLRTRVPVAVGRDRAAAGRLLLARHPGTDVLVCDDGLQHLRLARDAQLLVFDERGTGNGWLLPAGPLREPMPHGPLDVAGRVPTRVLYNAAAPTTALPGQRLQTGLAGAAALAEWWAGRPASATQLAELVRRSRREPLLAAAGTARPGRFFAMLERAGLAIRPLPLPDHHGYATLPWPAGTPEVLLTEKDAVKLRPERLGTTRAWVLPLDSALDEATATWLHDTLARAARPAP